jgi:tRNA-dihydrouridine synthase B
MQLNWKSHPRPIIALSPMADMTDSAFCQVVKHVTQNELPANNDYPIVFREMVSAEAVVRGNNKTLDMTDIHPAERPLVQQIFGSDPATMAEAARIIEAQHHPEGFDVNMGCPVYKIVHNFNGAALMKEPELAAKIVKSMKAVITVPLSIKIRLGWSEPTECLTFAKVLEDAGADLITIHGRTKAQGYAGVADWEMIRRAKDSVSIPVLANGDIHKAELMPKALEISGCDGVLIARGALGNPWIFRDYALIMTGQTPPPITLQERLEVVKLHLKLHLEQYGPTSLNTFRKHLSWYFKGLPNFKQYKEPLMKATQSDEILKIFNSMLV